MLIVWQWYGTPHLNTHPPGLLIAQLPAGRHNRPEQVQPPMIIQDQQRLDEERTGPAGENGTQGLGLGMLADHAAAQKRFPPQIGRQDILDRDSNSSRISSPWLLA